MNVYGKNRNLLFVFVVGINMAISHITSASIINVPFSGSIYNINDPNNILLSNLGLDVAEGDDYSGSYTINDALMPGSISNGETYNFNDPSMVFEASFGASGSLNNLNSVYRLSIYNDYLSDEYGGWSRRYGDVDAWVVSAAVGGGVDMNGDNYLNILDFVYLDTTQSMLDSVDLYFEDSSAGWEFSGLAITQWYADLDDRNGILLSTLPLNPVPSPPTLLLFLIGVLGIFYNKVKYVNKK